MELPEEVIKLKKSLAKESRKRGAELWEQVRSRPKKQEPKIPRCANCRMYGHTHEVHVKTTSLYEIIGGKIGCSELVLVYTDAEQVQGQFLTKVPRYRHWHKQVWRTKNR